MTKKIRVSVPLPEPLYNQIKTESEALGITMSSWIAFKVGEQLRIQIELKNQIQEKIGDSFENIIKKEITTGDGR